MIGAVYIEEAIADHPRTRAIRARFPRVPHIPCARYGEVFNRRAQSFRLQKQRPSLILARKHGKLVLDTPAGYGIGTARNHYLSHMLNCPYDCRYCFLQGMYRSAHYVVFVNYEDFFQAIEQTAAAAAGEAVTFFTGYDADSLAFERVTGFVAAALPVLRRLDNAWCELRTKSVQLEVLRRAAPWPRCVVAFSFTPEAVSRALEHGVPPVARRLRAMAELASRGFALGLRFDPLIYSDDYQDRYRALFAQVFQALPAASVHSVSLGPFRLPAGYFRAVERHYPDEALFAGPLARHGGMVSYRPALEREMVAFCSEALLGYVPAERFFPCPL